MNTLGALSLFFIVLVLVNDSQGWWGRRKKKKWGCDRWPKPDYSKCRLGWPCNPRWPNSCPCHHACCRLNTESNSWKGVGISIPIGRKKRGFSIGKGKICYGNICGHGAGGKLPPQPLYICYKKGECGKKCGQPWAKFNKVDKCGCGVGLTCKKNRWYQSRRCRYD